MLSSHDGGDGLLFGSSSHRINHDIMFTTTKQIRQSHLAIDRGSVRSMGREWAVGWGVVMLERQWVH